MSNSAVEISADPGVVAAARKEWTVERERRLSELLRHPEDIRRYEAENLALVRENRERSMAALSGLRDDLSIRAEKRINAIIALQVLDVSATCRDARFLLVTPLTQLHFHFFQGHSEVV